MQTHTTGCTFLHSVFSDVWLVTWLHAFQSWVGSTNLKLWMDELHMTPVHWTVWSSMSPSVQPCARNENAKEKSDESVSEKGLQSSLSRFTLCKLGLAFFSSLFCCCASMLYCTTVSACNTAPLCQHVIRGCRQIMVVCICLPPSLHKIFVSIFQQIFPHPIWNILLNNAPGAWRRKTNGLHSKKNLPHLVISFLSLVVLLIKPHYDSGFKWLISVNLIFTSMGHFPYSSSLQCSSSRCKWWACYL